MIKLSILVCHLQERAGSLISLLNVLLPDIATAQRVDVGPCLYAYRSGEVEVLIHDAPKPYAVGQKRNELVAGAAGLYVAHVDDDDTVHADYVKEVLRCIVSGPDTVGIVGIINEGNGVCRQFRHSITYAGWYENGGVYYRNSNHLNPTLKEIAAEVPFPCGMSYGEDRIYSDGIKPYLKTEEMVKFPVYFYNPSMQSVPMTVTRGGPK